MGAKFVGEREHELLGVVGQLATELGERPGSAVRRSGGQLVAGGRIPTQALAAALEADESTTKEGV